MSTSESAASARLDTLLERCADGDRTSFAALYTETVARTFGLARRMLRDDSLAEDAVHEAYLTIWRTSARFDPHTDTSTAWIFTIVRQSAVDRARSAEGWAARKDHESQDATPHRVEAGGPNDDLAHGRPEARRVRAALTGLSDVQRQALELAYFDGHTHAEVAEILGIPPATAGTHIRDGLIRLRQSMSG